MSVIRHALITGAAVSVAVGLMTPVAQAQTTSAYSGCDRGEICVYQEVDGGGKPCHWDGNDSNWESGGTVCSWAGPKMHAQSVWNRGTGSFSSVKFYFFAGYSGFFACAHGNVDGREGTGYRGNIGPDAGVHIQSHKWASSC